MASITSSRLRSGIPDQSTTTTSNTINGSNIQLPTKNNNNNKFTSPSSKYLIFLVLTITIGSLYSLTQVSPAITSFRSRVPSSSQNINSMPVPSLPYFADKSNLFNRLFVKKGWAWTSLIWFLFNSIQYLSPPLLPPLKKSTSNTSNLQSLSLPAQPVDILTKEIYRWLSSTLIWYYLTQATWFLFAFGKGPSIYHKVLLATGAQCFPSSLGTTPNTEGLLEEGIGMCIGSKGEYWKGGHDVSGHIFLLVHSSLLLFRSLQPLIPHLLPFLYLHPPSPLLKISTPLKLISYTTMTLMGLWWWMLLMTSVHFHTPLEKATGLGFAILSWLVVL